MSTKGTVRLDGRQVTKLEYNDDGTVKSALLKLGKYLYMPIQEHMPCKIIEHDTGMYLFGNESGEEETHKNYSLILGDLDLEDDYKYFSQLIGGDLRSDLFQFAMTEDLEWKQARYSVIKDKLNIREW